jgi:cytochrome c oxidase cbb3-type subunit 1
MAYTGVSLQGIMQALVEVNTVTHFTHWTIAHAHMGVYAFVTFTLFGTIYYMLPRIVGRLSAASVGFVRRALTVYPTSA